MKAIWLRLVVWFAAYMVTATDWLGWRRTCMLWSRRQHLRSRDLAVHLGKDWQYAVQGKFPITFQRVQGGGRAFIFDAEQLKRLPDLRAVGEALFRAELADLFDHEIAQQLFTAEEERRSELTERFGKVLGKRGRAAPADLN